MKTALISDLHANRQAFESVLDHARRQGARHFALLGDYVGYGSDPGWVIDQVRTLRAEGAIVVAGNHDLGVTQGPRPTMNDDARVLTELVAKDFVGLVVDDEKRLLGILTKMDLVDHLTGSVKPRREPA